ncbi:MAG: S-methyl-5-thioribose-1-phosphate isomerase [Polyangiaceae bacterium]
MNLPTLRTGLALPHPEPIAAASFSAVELMPGDRTVALLDQRRLPAKEHYDMLTTVAGVATAIRTMAVRGAPAIGVAAAYGMVLAAAENTRADAAAFDVAMSAAADLLRATRPTAVNLAWATDRMVTRAATVAAQPGLERLAELAREARAIHTEDVAACRQMGELGAALLPDGANVLTHCNAGALATGGYGSALGVVRAARTARRLGKVFVGETRPLLQGARLTAWELLRDGIPVTVVTDSMAAVLMQRGELGAVIVGADRIAANGDVANKIGTYGLACIAAAHGVPLLVVAPWSTVDMSCATGASIPIEERAASEVTHVTVGDASVTVAPEAAGAWNPAFDVTPARLVHAIVTERGVVRPVEGPGLERLARLR